MLALLSVRASNKARILMLSMDLLEVERLRRAFSEKVSSARGYALSGDPLFAQDMALARQRFIASLRAAEPPARREPGAALLESAVRAEREHEVPSRRCWRPPRTRLQPPAAGADLRGARGPGAPACLRCPGAAGGARRGAAVRGVSRTRWGGPAGAGAHPAGGGAGAVGGGGAGLGADAPAAAPPARGRGQREQRFRLLVEGVRDYAHAACWTRRAAWRAGTRAPSA